MRYYGWHKTAKGAFLVTLTVKPNAPSTEGQETAPVREFKKETDAATYVADMNRLVARAKFKGAEWDAKALALVKTIAPIRLGMVAPL